MIGDISTLQYSTFTTGITKVTYDASILVDPTQLLGARQQTRIDA